MLTFPLFVKHWGHTNTHRIAHRSKGINKTVAWEMYFQKEGYSPHAQCGTPQCGAQNPRLMIQMPCRGRDRGASSQAQNPNMVPSSADATGPDTASADASWERAKTKQADNHDGLQERMATANPRPDPPSGWEGRPRALCLLYLGLHISNPVIPAFAARSPACNHQR